MPWQSSSSACICLSPRFIKKKKKATMQIIVALYLDISKEIVIHIHNYSY